MKPSLEPTPRTSEELEEEQLRQMMGEVTIGGESVKDTRHSTIRKVGDIVDGDANKLAKLTWMQETSEKMPLMDGTVYPTTARGYYTPPNTPAQFMYRSHFEKNSVIKPIDWDAYFSKPNQ